MSIPSSILILYEYSELSLRVYVCVCVYVYVLYSNPTLFMIMKCLVMAKNVT